MTDACHCGALSITAQPLEKVALRQRGRLAPLRWGVPLSVAPLVVSICCFFFFALLPAHADPGRFLTGSDDADLRAALAALQPAQEAATSHLSAAEQQRLKDLQFLQNQIARADERAQLRNSSSHNLGFFATHKRDSPAQPPSFYVLAPGHSTDDDFSLRALLIPAGVSLVWGEQGTSPAISTGPRLLRVLEGQQLTVRDIPLAAAGPADQPPPETAAAGSQPGLAAPPAAAHAVDSAAATPLTYALSQPPFQLLSRWELQPLLPDLSQAALDQEPETAPLD